MIQFTSDLLPSNPAYNDSIIRYNSTITGMTKSDITIAGQNPFTVYPFNETFSYNFKDIVKVLINQSGFADSIIPDLQNDFIYSDSSLLLEITPTITTYNSTTADTISKTYSFTKSVEQLPFYNQKINNQSDVKVLLPTSDNFNYSVTYFEGYPFDFSIRGLKSGDTYCFRNSSTGMVSENYSSQDNHVKRIFLSDGAINETINQTLIMLSNVNPIELWVNNELKANIRIKRVESQCGIYLKWFNQYGGYSYWLFDKIYKENINVKEIDDLVGKWDNLQNITSTSESFGKTATQSFELSTSFSDDEKEYVIDILKSPTVQKYIHHIPFVKMIPYSFLGVSMAAGNFQFQNKFSKNKLKVNIEMPSINTITL